MYNCPLETRDKWGVSMELWTLVGTEYDKKLRRSVKGRARRREWLSRREVGCPAVDVFSDDRMTWNVREPYCPI